jgi:3',5'-cyclic AMP phosphodiesterase CpdA
MSTTVTIAHLTDVHLSPIAGFSPRYWNLKRAVGYVNWARKRRFSYPRHVLDRIVADMQAQAPDHIAITGDLANIGLPGEHAHGLRWLESLGAPERVTVIPGNHDIYSDLGRDPGTRRWARFMASNAEGATFAPAPGDDFPFVRVLARNVALVGVNSAIPTPPLMAWGEVGADQLRRLGAILEALARANLFRVVLIHHPPLPGQASAARGLKDAAALEALLARHGAELVIHGHNHMNVLAWRRGPAGAFPIVGAPSASLGQRHGREPLARYNLYRVDSTSRGIEMIGRGLAEPGAPVTELERRTLAPSTAHA